MENVLRNKLNKVHKYLLKQWKNEKEYTEEKKEIASFIDFTMNMKRRKMFKKIK